MKTLNWGKFILFIYVSFVLLMLFMVYMASTQSFDLVADDYYKQEIEFQSKINASNNQATKKFSWEINQLENELIVRLNGGSNEKKAVGSIDFFRPSNPKLDISIPLNLDSNGNQKISTEKLQIGAYVLKINYKIDHTEFFDQRNIYIK